MAQKPANKRPNLSAPTLDAGLLERLVAKEKEEAQASSNELKALKEAARLQRQLEAELPAARPRLPIEKKVAGIVVKALKVKEGSKVKPLVQDVVDFRKQRVLATTQQLRVPSLQEHFYGRKGPGFFASK